jgi:hypothetical protein
MYRYQSGSLIDEVQILTNESGGTRAYFYARSDATPEQLTQIQSVISSLGWKSVPSIHDGRAALEIRGFKNPLIALQTITAQRWGIGTPAVTAQEDDVPSTSEKFANATLRTAGFSYILGDFCYITYATKQYLHELSQGSKSKNFFNRVNIVAGFGYALGSIALGAYGSRDQSQNTIRSASEKVRHYLRKETIEVPDDTSMHTITRDEKRGFWGSINHTFAKFPSETLNGVYVLVGIALSACALFRASRPGISSKERNEELWDVGLGVVTASSAITGLVVKEKKPIAGEPKRKGFGAILDWIQEKPLRATGFGYMVATGFHGVGTYKKYQNGDKVVRDTAAFRGAFVGTNILSEVLMALSSKGHGQGVKPDDSIDKTVIASTAEVILRQPEEKREALVEQLAGYMASPEVLGSSAPLIAMELRTQMRAIADNPWAGKVVAQVRTFALPERVEAPQLANETEVPTARIREASLQQPLLAANDNHVSQVIG